ncbi:bifunctional acetate--CoA ligase family protein/GNAT family N-acetyltransferase [Rubrivivax albus]|uniref:Bifunctional acyl-CoA synthetase/GNAT family N-acetyltransferase n=1 Tax=Rubrivivax albus TaxID=2499835 RepID=A0A3S2WWY2_9BURK|nr:bifunctional acetate--CoA ligase family protein/GNAT family N-acetyltransferase [Rubrivivax albus]RVT53713.1 bifunctional acyl-CoA synthetase/GNAT family N-acetyltransferase [Rubrivivax albus]
MSIRHLDSLFDPASVAVIGASLREASVGGTVWRNLRAGGFAGPVWPVNPKHATLGEVPCFASVDNLPQAPELAVICTPPATVPGLIAALGARGTKAAVVLTAGFDAAQKQAMLDAARAHLLRILGPNCLGLLAPHIGLNASFAHVNAEPGQLAFVSQSGALVTALLDWARARGVGFSHFVSLGESADVDFGDMLDWLAGDAKTRAILLYVESIREARKFMSAARAAARNKPVILVKAGRSAQGQAAASSHTGALAGSDAVFDAAVQRAGLLRVDTLQDLFDAALTLDRLAGGSPGIDPDRLTVVTNGGGAGVMAADAAAQAGLTLAPLGDTVRAQLDAALPANWSHANPVDLIGDAPEARYLAAFDALLADPAAGMLLFTHAPTAIVPSARIAEALVPKLQPQATRLVSAWLGGDAVAQARARFQAAGLACYDTPEQAVQAVATLATWKRHQAALLETPTADAAEAPFDIATAQAVIDSALAEGREMLTEPEAKAVLAAAGIPVAATRRVGLDADEAVAAARAIGWPVALKILSTDISHKSDVGGVVLDLADEAALRGAIDAMLARVRARRPDAALQGFSVQAMVKRSQALELIVGASLDPLFGPVILFGQGGTAVEVVADRALALPPLNRPLARALVERTRIAKLMHGWRDVPPVAMDAVLDTLVHVSRLLAALPAVVELDINPLLADARGVVALDARVRVLPGAPAGEARFAIRPYPAALMEHWDWQGRPITVRPIRPEDEARHRAFLERLDPEDIRLRIFYSRRSIEHSELARLTQIDYEREMAFIALDANGDTLAVVRGVTDPDNVGAEFGIVVRSDLKGGGLGERLLRKLIDYHRSRGTQVLTAEVLAENARMLALARDLGFTVEPGAEAGVKRVRLAL